MTETYGIFRLYCTTRIDSVSGELKPSIFDLLSEYLAFDELNGVKNRSKYVLYFYI